MKKLNMFSILTNIAFLVGLAIFVYPLLPDVRFNTDGMFWSQTAMYFCFLVNSLYCSIAPTRLPYSLTKGIIGFFCCSIAMIGIGRSIDTTSEPFLEHTTTIVLHVMTLSNLALPAIGHLRFKRKHKT